MAKTICGNFSFRVGRPGRAVCCRSPNHENPRFWRKNCLKNLKSKGKSIKFGHGNAKEARSTSLATDLWIKTYPNAQDSQIDPKANWGYFWWKFSNFSKSKKNLGVLWGKQSQIRVNRGLWYHMMWVRSWSSRIWGRIWGRTRRTHEGKGKHKVNSKTIRTNSTGNKSPRAAPDSQTPSTLTLRIVSLNGQSNRPNRVTRRWKIGK